MLLLVFQFGGGFAEAVDVVGEAVGTLFGDDLLFLQLQQLLFDVFAAELALVSAGEQLGGKVVGVLVLLLVLALLLLQGALVLLLLR